MFLDASAIVAILSREPEADRFSDLIEHSKQPLTSPIAIFESVTGLCRKRKADPEEVEADVQAFLAMAGVECVPLTADDSHTALVAFSRYGNGTGHPAQLNLGDCFAYAVAHNRGIALLFKGDDFGKTDVVRADA